MLIPSRNREEKAGIVVLCSSSGHVTMPEAPYSTVRCSMRRVVYANGLLLGGSHLANDRALLALLQTSTFVDLSS